MRFYPPLLFQRIWVVGFDKDFKGVKVKVAKSWLNKNYNGSIFGGTIFAAADPFYPVLFHQALQSKQRRLKVWSKSARIDFIKPALTDLYFNVVLNNDDITEAITALNNTGKFEKSFLINMYDDNGEVCASLINEVYLRDQNFNQATV